MSTVIAFGNPVLDSIVKLKSADIITKFNLQKDGHKQVAAPELQEILKVVKNQNYTWSNVPGGSAVNTMRLLQWLYQNAPSTTVFGSVGSDTMGILLRKMVEDFLVKTIFAQIEKQTTGWVLSLAHDSSRSLVASIGAAESYAVNHFDTYENKLHIKRADIIFMEGFFLTKRKEVSRFILDLINEAQKTFVFNLNAEYLITELTAEMSHFADNATILFGNEPEFAMLSQALNLPREEMIKKLLATKTGKQLVITNGADAVFVYTEKEALKYDVPVLTPEQIVDTTGCGDAFAAGYIFAYLNGHTPLTCIKWGTWMAQQVIGQIGCTPPGVRVSPSEIKKIQ